MTETERNDFCDLAAWCKRVVAKGFDTQEENVLTLEECKSILSAYEEMLEYGLVWIAI